MTNAQWEAVRTALAETGERFADIVENAPDPGAKAIGVWSVAETAAHVGWIAHVYTALVHGDGRSLPLPELEEQIAKATIETVSAMNDVAQEAYPERDPRLLAKQLRADVAELLRAGGEYGPDKVIDWLGGSRVPLPGLFAHLLNELEIHGHDIARASGQEWRIEAAHVGMFLDLFFTGMVRNDLGRLLAHAKPSPRRVAVEFRSDHTAPVMLVLQHGELRAEEPDGTADARLTFDPAVLVPMMFGRISPLRAVGTGKVRVGGRRPWRLPEFLRTVHMP
ncbi:maleylpyruvate isomerase N-terminal domain-containing protein [Amycolatopsis sp. NPDC003861]